MAKKLFFRASICLLLAIPFFLTLESCNNPVSNAPDVKNIQVSLQTSRFDLDLYAIDTNNIGDGLKKLQAKYPDFLNYFLDTIMAYGIHGNYTDTIKGVREGLKPFLSFKDFKELEDTIKQRYPDTRSVDDELTSGFKYLKYYLPTAVIPRIIYLNMGLSNWPSFPVDNTTMCIGLDMFLGDKYPYYRSIGVPEYMGTHLRKSYIPVSVFGALYKSYHPFHPDDRTLLDLMIQRGKEQYFLHKILPGNADSTLFGFTQTQINWCSANEALIYNFFIQQQLLYSKEAHNIMPYVNDGPFARGLQPPGNGTYVTPGNIGTWLGYKIVSAYMARHTEITLAQLLDLQTDAAKILEDANYRPK